MQGYVHHPGNSECICLECKVIMEPKPMSQKWKKKGKKRKGGRY